MALQTRRFFRFHDDLRQHEISWRYVSANPQYQKGTTRIRQYVSERFSGTVAISPPIVSAYYLQAPNRGRELSFREAVLPLMYRVREDGLQTANAFRNALHGGDAKRGGAAARLAVVRAIGLCQLTQHARRMSAP